MNGNEKYLRWKNIVDMLKPYLLCESVRAALSSHFDLYLTDCGRKVNCTQLTPCRIYSGKKRKMFLRDCFI